MPADSAQPSLHTMASAIRALSMDAVEAAKSGHPGMPMGMADVATVLFTQFLKFDPKNPSWPDRDRFVLSAGHGSMLLYSLAYLTGYERMTIDEIKRFRQLHSLTPGHPEVDPSLGIEMTTGPLGQGVSTAVGMALAERITNARFGDELIDHYTYVIASDGDLMEGVSHEACSLAGHLGLNRLIVLWDDNHISIDGTTDLSFTDDTQARFRSYGWNTIAVDGHDTDAVSKAIAQARTSTDKPTLIACRTIIGKGAPNKANSHACHGSPLGADEIAATRTAIGWTHEPFVVPDEVLSAWRAAGTRSVDAYSAWSSRRATLSAEAGRAFDEAFSHGVPSALTDTIVAFKQKISAEKPSWATRVASGNTLEVLVPAIPEMVGGSADLTPSNNTKVKNTADVKGKGEFAGRYVRYGVREHGMATLMNGMTLHGGIIPYGGTFMQFADYCRPAIRLAALMKQRTVFVMTHDSIGLGEDGPTHQPVEHLAALRAIPNLLVLRPADAVETAECWQIALEATGSPSVLALTRQNVPTLRTEHTAENLSARGAYVLAEAEGARKATILATGSEVSLAMEARKALQAQGIGTAVVSMPSWELFERQDDAYKASVLGTGVRVGVEAAIRLGWDRWLGDKGAFVGMAGFGESAPYQELYKHFGITAEAVVDAVKARL
ncbi:transketolase [Azospirillum lipoferum]|uniref:Transketolase n=1 Tax=Azospirillum lipoferum TaxID=193 RepID=A0A5A9GRW3_AZOLI|nr:MULTISPECIES: transketolase [Azospirillum]KAA0597160.1 transketolase [Azospirillum lipoferum]MCP1608658.1 transketolase [Azospirillum lipoferum]MDW5536024.1 transketolase [Azospirillum sp. NL1]